MVYAASPMIVSMVLTNALFESMRADELETYAREDELQALPRANCDFTTSQSEFVALRSGTTYVYSPTALLPKILNLLRNSLRPVGLFSFVRNAQIDLILGKHSSIDLGFS
jgi:hypothetical protein